MGRISQVGQIMQVVQVNQVSQFGQVSQPKSGEESAIWKYLTGAEELSCSIRVEDGNARACRKMRSRSNARIPGDAWVPPNLLRPARRVMKYRLNCLPAGSLRMQRVAQSIWAASARFPSYVGNSLPRVTLDGITHVSDTSRVGRVTSDVFTWKRDAIHYT